MYFFVFCSIFVLFVYFCVLCIVCFVTFLVLFVCIFVLNNCHRVVTQMQLNIIYIISYSISYFKFRYILVSLRSNTSFFHRCHRIPVPFIGPSINCCRRHFVNKMRPIPFGVLSFILSKSFPSSLTNCNATLEKRNRFSLSLIHGRLYYNVPQHKKTIWKITTVKP
jgi:hypothetical protein